MEDEKKTAFGILTKESHEEILDSKSYKESLGEESLKILFDPTDIEMKADLSKKMIGAMARGGTFVDIYKSDVMEKFILKHQILSVSNARKGRGEAVMVIRNSQEVFEGNDFGALQRAMGK